jgi:hypothetical protein
MGILFFTGSRNFISAPAVAKSFGFLGIKLQKIVYFSLLYFCCTQASKMMINQPSERTEGGDDET